MNNDQITLAITGASGSAYGIRLLECCLQAGKKVNLLISNAAHVVIATETNHQFAHKSIEIQNYFCGLFNAPVEQLSVFSKDQWMSPIASGSNVANSMVVCPCSSATLSAIACGTSNNLIERAADVSLKEKRQLILVTREMPLSSIHLENMLKLSNMGVTIMPASPGFYHQPESIETLIDFVVARILDHLNIKHDLMPRWCE